MPLVSLNNEKEKNYHEMSIKEIMKDVFLRRDLVDRQGRISPSSGCSFCSRQAYLRGVEVFHDNWETSSEMYARNGVLIENMVAEGLQKADLLLGQGIRLWENEELKLGAEFDIATKQNNKFKIIECKTCSDLPSNITSKPYQYWQLLLYQAYYCCDGMLLYVSRKVMGKHGNEMDLLIKEFDSSFSLELSRTAIFRSAYSRFCIDNKLLPEKPSHITSKGHCGFCNFLDRCWNNELDNHEDIYGNAFSEAIDFSIDYVDKFFTKEQIELRRFDLYNKLLDCNINNFKNIHEFYMMFDYFGV